MISATEPSGKRVSVAADLSSPSSVFGIQRVQRGDLSPSHILGGRYRLNQRLGAGGMGSVWRADDLNLEAEVAIKLIDPLLAQSPEAVARFRREAQAAASIRSTYVVQILDYGIDEGIPFIAMELLHGESLARRLKRQKRLSPEEVVHLLGHVGRALALAHEHGIVHRDLKPDNIFLVREGDEEIAKLVDFGIARRPEGLDQATDLKTTTGALLGTPFYMSPEQATGQVADHQTDVWSFGAIAFECLTGERPFLGESLGALFHSICMADMPVPSRIAPVPEGFDDWFARSTARDKSRRFSTIKEGTEQLRRVCETSSVSTRLARQSQPFSRNPSTAAVASSRHDEQTIPPASRTLMGIGASRWTLPVFMLTLSASVASASALAVWIALRGNSGVVPDDSVIATVRHEAFTVAPRLETPTTVQGSESATAVTHSAISVLPVFVPSENHPFAGTRHAGATSQVAPPSSSTPAAIVISEPVLPAPAEAPLANAGTPSGAPTNASSVPNAPVSSMATTEQSRASLRPALVGPRGSIAGTDGRARKPSVPIGDNAAGI